MPTTKLVSFSKELWWTFALVGKNMKRSNLKAGLASGTNGSPTINHKAHFQNLVTPDAS